jgi:hypothetical protein
MVDFFFLFFYVKIEQFLADLEEKTYNVTKMICTIYRLRL